MKNVLLLDTSIGTLNTGDEIINVSIEKNWPELFEQNYIMRLATHTPMYSMLQRVLYNKRKLNVFGNADYKFLCGTNALYTNMLRPLPSWNINLLNCGLARGTVCLGVGIGVNSKKANAYTKALYHKVLSNKYVHSTRDEKTKGFLESMGFKAVNTGCPTLWGLTEEHCKTIPRVKSKSVLFTLTNYENDEANDKATVEILKRNYDSVLFWPQCIDDLDYLHRLDEAEGVTVVAPNIRAYDAALFGDIDYVGNRLHGGIFAMQHSCRSIILSIDYRAREMSENYSFTCIDRTEVASKLEGLINSEWETRITGLDFDLIADWKRQFDGE